MWRITEIYSNKIVMVDTKENCVKYLMKIAREENYGIFRTWTEDNATFYDCGRVFKLVESN